MEDDARRVLTELFRELSPEALEGLYRSARLVEYPANVTLCREGQVEVSFYIIVDGRVDVYKMLEGQRHLINQMSRGAHFGDIAILLDLPRTATIITAEPTKVFIIDREVYAHFIKTNPEMVKALSQIVIKRFIVQEEKYLTEIARLKRRDIPPAKVFMSYAREDEAFATHLANNLLKENIDIWLDVYRLDPGRSWARQIGEALDRCQIMLLVLSPAGVASENVDDEWNYHLDHKKPVVAVLHRPCKQPYRLSKLHHINFYQTDYDQALARLIATLNTQC